MGHKNGGFFDIYYVALKMVTYVMPYIGYASLVKNLLKFDLIKAHLSSLRFFSTYLGLLTWAHLGLFWAHIGLFWIYLGSFELIRAHLGRFCFSAHIGSFKLVWAHLGSLSLIKLIWALSCPINLDSFQLIKYILEKKHFNLCFTYSLKVISLLQSSVYILRKRNSNASIFVLWWSFGLHFGESVKYINVNFKFRCLSAYLSTPLQTWL